LPCESRAVLEEGKHRGGITPGMRIRRPASNENLEEASLKTNTLTMHGFYYQLFSFPGEPPWGFLITTVFGFLVLALLAHRLPLIQTEKQPRNIKP
jgi:hypothetical protein